MVSITRLPVWALFLSLMGCGIYSFSGTSIPPEVETFSVEFFENKATIVAPTLSQTLTEKLKTKFISETSLEIVEYDGDFSFSGYISGYDIKPVTASSTENAQLNRLTIRVMAKLDCEKVPKLNFEQTFENYQDFDAAADFSSIEEQLINEITDMIVQRIFNEAAINW